MERCEMTGRRRTTGRSWMSWRRRSAASGPAQGWTPSGRFSNWEDLEYGMKIFREAGGTHAVLANTTVDFGDRPGSAEMARIAELSMIGTPAEVREKLKRLSDLGFDELLLVSHHDMLEDIERARDLL